MHSFMSKRHTTKNQADTIIRTGCDYFSLPEVANWQLMCLIWMAAILFNLFNSFKNVSSLQYLKLEKCEINMQTSGFFGKTEKSDNAGLAFLHATHQLGFEFLTPVLQLRP